MSLSLFHPIVARWFGDTLGAPTAAQAQGWPTIREGRHTLIAAPTGSGKTLAAFLTSLDDLFQEGLRGPLPDEVRVVYVSPLKALSADIHKNLGEPRRGIRRLAEEAGLDAPRITAAVRTGDTTQAERAAMLRTPPHILVTTPESLYLLLTAERTRDMLRTARTVIVDEIHAVIGTRRGAHLALSLERLQAVAERPLVRLGLSATQKPIEEVARFLVGTASVDADGRAACAIVDEGHRRTMDLGLEIPDSALDAVMSHEVWEEYYTRLTQLVDAHRTTLVFVNTRRMAERIARHLSERLGEDAVTAHHGSLSKEKRLDAESRLKAGQLRALVATASLELGIDIGSVDLVCQIGSPRRIATLLQRVGRSGHSVSGTPKGRLFPTSRDDLIECLALLRASRHGDLDRIVSHEAPLDVLAQQIVAETACREYGDEELFTLMRGAWTYRDLARKDYDAVVTMAAEGFSTRRGRRAALLHRDEVQGRLRGRRGARMLAITSGGAIPEIADYRVLLEPEDTFVGTLNEDFAIESNAGDVFQLGNASWRILRIGAGVVRVADAKGAPPTIPFWLGEAPGRSDELSHAVSDLRAYVDRALPSTDGMVASDDIDPAANRGAVARWLLDETGAPEEAVSQALDYLSEGRAALGVLPTQDTLVLERFFDESGGMQLVLHAPFGSRINKAWGLALRKRFCRQFNFELQAAATEDALLLSLGPQHSFPLADVFRYLHPATARDVLVQAFLDAPVFQTRWRWNTTISLAVPRNRGGRKVPPPLQRMLADDLMAAVFPDAAACLENIPGDREIPDHPLVDQTVRDCLQEAMDFAGLTAVLARIHRGDMRCVSRDTPEPSALSHEILNARPYAFLDDAPLEERRAHAVYARRAGEPSRRGDDLGALDAGAIDRVRDEARPDPRDADELHDALLTAGILTEAEAAALPRDLFDRLTATRRAGRAQPASPQAFQASQASQASASVREALAADAAGLWIAAERLPELLAVHPGATVSPALTAPASRTARTWTREEALVEFVRGRLTIVGPTTARELAASLSIDDADAQTALLALEAEGAVLRGRFTPAPRGAARADGVRDGRHGQHANLRPAGVDGGGGGGLGGENALEWCDRRLLARIHRYTLNRLRAEIEPVSPAEFMRFLFAWQHVDPAHRVTGLDGLRAIAARLDGFELAANAWERAVLPARLDRYDPSMLDLLCLSGEVGWARLSTTTATTSTAPTAMATTNTPTLAGTTATRTTTARTTAERAGTTMRTTAARATPASSSDRASSDRASLDDASLDRASSDGPRRDRASREPIEDRTRGAQMTKLGGTTAIALFLREHAEAWQTLRLAGDGDGDGAALAGRARADGVSVAPGRAPVGMSAATGSASVAPPPNLLRSDAARQVFDVLERRGASFFRELVTSCGMDAATLRRALGELAAAGLVASDGFAGLRAIVQASRAGTTAGHGHDGRNDRNGRDARHARETRVDPAGRWSLLRGEDSPAACEAATERQAWTLLRRYGVVCRRLLAREANARPWRELARVYRRLEARGEIRGGRFVHGMSGEQFALPEAVDTLRDVRRTPPHGRLLVVSAADPLNLAGIVTPGDRVTARGSSRIVYRDGVPLAAMEGDYVRPLAEIPPAIAGDVANALAGRRVPPIISGYLGRAG